MKFGIPEKSFKAILKEIQSHLGDTSNPQVYIYGSRVKGNFREFSDIDILLVADKYDESALSQIDFESLDIAYKVDFVLDKDLYDAYRDEIYGHMVLAGS